MLWCDTRQQAGKHLHVDGWLASHGVEYGYRKLDFGDYMREGSNISVDTKQGLDELAQNLGKDNRRFVRECDRAAAAGCRLVVLVEDGERWADASALASWSCWACRRCGRCDPNDQATRCSRYRSKPMHGARLLGTMATIEKRHGARFEFCERSDTARAICDTLGVDYDRG